MGISSPRLKNILIFQVLIFQEQIFQAQKFNKKTPEKVSYILVNGTFPKKMFFIFPEGTCKAPKTKTSYIFSKKKFNFLHQNFFIRIIKKILRT